MFRDAAGRIVSGVVSCSVMTNASGCLVMLCFRSPEPNAIH